MRFDELIASGKDTEAARFLAKEYYYNGKMGQTRRLLIERLADRVDELEAMQQEQSDWERKYWDLAKSVGHTDQEIEREEAGHWDGIAPDK